MGAGTATFTGTGQIANVPSGDNGFGRYPISGNQYFDTGSVFTITFSTAIAAFGFFGVDIGDFGGQVTLTLTHLGAANNGHGAKHDQRPGRRNAFLRLHRHG